MNKLREAVKVRKAVVEVFNKINRDSRLSLGNYGYDFKLECPTAAVMFCEKEKLTENLPIMDESDGVELAILAYLFNIKRFDPKWRSETLRMELTKNTLNKRPVAHLKVKNYYGEIIQNVRIPYRMADMLLEHNCIKVVNSNREAYISDVKYFDWFELESDNEELLHDLESIP